MGFGQNQIFIQIWRILSNFDIASGLSAGVALDDDTV